MTTTTDNHPRLTGATVAPVAERAVIVLALT